MNLTTRSGDLYWEGQRYTQSRVPNGHQFLSSNLQMKTCFLVRKVGSSHKSDNNLSEQKISQL